jgi:tRNA G18 (ribose-2'-O)-methylase SpoU
VAEGKVVLDVLLASPGYETLSLLLLENRVAGLSDTLARVPPATPVHVAEARVIDSIAGFHVHRGVLALGRRRNTPAATELLGGLPPRALVLVLAGISNHDNAGSIFRNAAAFGVDAVFLDTACCDPLYRKAIRVSVGGVFRVPFARFEHMDGFLGLLGRHGFRCVALSPRGKTDIGALERQDRMALLLGTEGEGLPEALLSRMETARIAMASGFDSLNVAAASAIALHRLADAARSG